MLTDTIINPLEGVTMTRFCPKCQVETERNKKGDCKPCAIVRVKKWIENNREKHNQYCAKWQKNYPEKNRETSNRYRQKNIASILKKDKERRAKDPEKYVQLARNYAKKYPDKVNARNAQRRAKRKEQSGIVSKNIIEKLKELQKSKCPCCQQPLSENYHLDHIVPLSLGGKHEDSNLQLLIANCNQQKYNKHPIDFMQSKGFLL
jgi:5-methylcytosine-specific restriction endonuclease McrA